ncbi:DUF3667 domain-containing protein [Eisenibacter elegans]|uniref:DUF3667 domain-containing protein n=1 Tax=Eisenibacter elegans TaxID=997 RepID=UPI0009D7423F
MICFPMNKQRIKTDQCLNCGYIFDTPVNYCPQCGQENHQKVRPLRYIVYDFLNDVGQLDNRLWRSLWPFLSKPGYPSQAYIEGKRTKYVTPIRLYVVCSFFIFLRWPSLRSRSCLKTTPSSAARP